MSSEPEAFAMSAGSLSKGRIVSTPETRTRDVAAAAGVSVATVWNVLNNPDVVAPRTRDRVEQVVDELGFQPTQHARERRGRRWSRMEISGANPGQDGAPGQPESSAAKTPGLGHEQVPPCRGVDVSPGDHVTVRVGPEVFSGTVDAVMPDNSYFWILTDNGMGRRLIEAATAATAHG